MKKQKLRNRHYRQLQAGFTSWLETLGYSASSVYYIPLLVQGFLFFQEEKKRSLADWQGAHLRAYMEYCKTRRKERHAGGLSSGHLNKIVQALQLFQQYLLQTEQGEYYTTLEQLEVIKKPLEIFSKKEIQELYEACQPTLIGIRQRAILGLLYGCGLRAGEAWQLEVKDLWWERGVLQVRQSKTKTSRLVPLASRVLEDLKRYSQEVRPALQSNKDCPHFLLTIRGGKMSHQTLYKGFQVLLRRAELPPAGLHILRHSIASHLAASGMKSEQIAQLLGHKTLDSTQIYVHLNSSKDEH